MLQERLLGQCWLFSLHRYSRGWLLQIQEGSHRRNVTLDVGHSENS